MFGEVLLGPKTSVTARPDTTTVNFFFFRSGIHRFAKMDTYGGTGEPHQDRPGPAILFKERTENDTHPGIADSLMPFSFFLQVHRAILLPNAADILEHCHGPVRRPDFRGKGEHPPTFRKPPWNALQAGPSCTPPVNRTKGGGI